MHLIKENKIIHDCLVKRWKELGEYANSIIADAEERGMKLTKARMSNYINKGESLTEKQVIWLCFRYGIPVSVAIGSPEIDNGKIKYVIPEYNELECIKKIEKHKHLFK